MKHKVVRVNDLMYKGCEPHWKCIYCEDCWPFHCYTKKDLESMECAKNMECAKKEED